MKYSKIKNQKLNSYYNYFIENNKISHNMSSYDVIYIFKKLLDEKKYDYLQIILNDFEKYNDINFFGYLIKHIINEYKKNKNQILYNKLLRIYLFYTEEIKTTVFFNKIIDILIKYEEWNLLKIHLSINELITNTQLMNIPNYIIKNLDLYNIKNEMCFILLNIDNNDELLKILNKENINKYLNLFYKKKDLLFFKRLIDKKIIKYDINLISLINSKRNDIILLFLENKIIKLNKKNVLNFFQIKIKKPKYNKLTIYNLYSDNIIIYPNEIINIIINSKIFKNLPNKIKKIINKIIILKYNDQICDNIKNNYGVIDILSQHYNYRYDTFFNKLIRNIIKDDNISKIKYLFNNGYLNINKRNSLAILMNNALCFNSRKIIEYLKELKIRSSKSLCNIISYRVYYGYNKNKINMEKFIENLEYIQYPLNKKNIKNFIMIQNFPTNLLFFLFNKFKINISIKLISKIFIYKESLYKKIIKNYPQNMKCKSLCDLNCNNINKYIYYQCMEYFNTELGRNLIKAHKIFSEYVKQSKLDLTKDDFINSIFIDNLTLILLKKYKIFENYINELFQNTLNNKIITNCICRNLENIYTYCNENNIYINNEYIIKLAIIIIENNGNTFILNSLIKNNILALDDKLIKKIIHIPFKNYFININNILNFLKDNNANVKTEYFSNIYLTINEIITIFEYYQIDLNKYLTYNKFIKMCEYMIDKDTFNLAKLKKFGFVFNLFHIKIILNNLSYSKKKNHIIINNILNLTYQYNDDIKRIVLSFCPNFNFNNFTYIQYIKSQDEINYDNNNLINNNLFNINPFNNYNIDNIDDVDKAILEASNIHL